MHTCISSHGLKRSWRSCPRRVNAGNKNTPSTHHPRRRNVTTLMVGLKNGHIRKNLTQKVVNPRDIAGERKKKKKKKKNHHHHSHCFHHHHCHTRDDDDDDDDDCHRHHHHHHHYQKIANLLITLTVITVPSWSPLLLLVWLQLLQLWELCGWLWHLLLLSLSLWMVFYYYSSCVIICVVFSASSGGVQSHSDAWSQAGECCSS